MIEKFLKPKHPVEKKESIKKINLSRRKFLNQLTATIITSSSLSWGFSSWLKKFLMKKFQEDLENSKKEEQEVLKLDRGTDFKEQKLRNDLNREQEIKESKEFGSFETDEDALSLEEIIKFDSREKLVLDKNSMERLKKHWEEVYQNKLRKSFDKAWQRMGFWEEEALKNFLIPAEKYCQEKILKEERESFLNNFKEFFYLSIPESHWDVWAESSFAKGPFQFTKKTAVKFNLKIKTNYDERTDPEKSAFAASKYLLNLYEKMNFDWNLVLSGYNGGFVWEYKKIKTYLGEKISYEDYLIYLSEKIEKIKKEALYNKKLTHKIKKGESWVQIAKKYGCKEIELKKNNQAFLKKGLIEGKLLILPINNITRKRYFQNQISGFSENINYPAKFLAVIDVLKKRKEQQDLPKKEKPPVFVIKKIIKQKADYKKIQIKKGDVLAKIASKYNISVNKLKKINRIKNEKKLPKTLLIPEKKITLDSLADGNKGLLEVLHKLNPAIQDVKAPIPNGVEIKLLILKDF